VHAVRRAGDLTGKKVLVIGAGPIGLFTALAARAAGAERVVVADIIASKRERALRLGADAAFDSSTEDAGSEALEAIGGAAHVVFDCVSHVTTVRLAIEVLSKGGRLQVVGVPAGETLVALDLIQDRELTVAGNLMYVREDMVRALEILRPKPFDIDELVTATFDLAQAADAFHAAADPDQVKVLVTVSA
jgi:threonine dehydrogenase-like Zn-dependent dehydrogenase